MAQSRTREPRGIRQGTYRLADGTYKKGGYKLRMRLDVGPRFTPQVIDFGLDTHDRREAIEKAKLLLAYAEKVNSRMRPPRRILEAEIQAPKKRVAKSTTQLTLGL